VKRTLVALFALTVLTACGADDPPFRPTANAGVNIGTGGVSTNVDLGATNGTFSVGLSL